MELTVNYILTNYGKEIKYLKKTFYAVTVGDAHIEHGQGFRRGQQLVIHKLRLQTSSNLSVTRVSQSEESWPKCSFANNLFCTKTQYQRNKDYVELTHAKPL